MAKIDGIQRVSIIGGIVGGGDRGINLSDDLPLDIAKTKADAGKKPTASRSDHRHSIDTGPPTDITAGDTSAEGTSPALARADHKHATPETWKPSPHPLSEHTPATTPISCGGQQLVDIVVENVSDLPPTALPGRIVYNTVDKRLYVFIP